MKKHIWLYRLGGLLLFSFLLLFSPGSTRSVEAKDTMIYALDITTGSQGESMDAIKNIIINYKDKNNRERAYSINPKSAAQYTWQYLLNSKNKETSESMKKLLTDSNASKLSFVFGESVNLFATNEKFMPYTQQTILFSVYDEIESGKIESFQILTSQGISWNVQRIALAKVDTSQAMTCFGYGKISPVYQIDYKGTLLAEVNKTFSISAAQGASIYIGGKRGVSGAEIVQKETEIEKREKSTYYVKMDIADEAMAGMETNETAPDGKSSVFSSSNALSLADMLYVDVYYEDTHGNSRVASVPVISNAYLSVKAGADDKIIGVGQQGDTLVVACTLPEFSKILEGSGQNRGVDIEYGFTNIAAHNMALSDDQNTLASADYRAKGRDQRAKDTNEQLALTNVELYSANNTTLTTGIKDGTMNFELSGKDKDSKASPIYYYASASRSGTNIQYGQTQKFRMKKNTSGGSVTAQNNVNNMYLVEVSTADAASAGTTDNLKISFAYKALDGSNKTTKEYSMKEATNDFYGYWPAIGAAASDFAYIKGVSSKGSLKFLITLTDVDTFQSATITLDGSDEWQVKKLEISKVKALKKRTATFEDINFTWSGGTLSTDRSFDRDVTKGATMAISTEEVLFRANEKKQISFTGEKSTLENENKAVWDPTITEIDYETACKGLGFNNANVKYSVNVQVGGSDADGTDDSGSKNLFYFRLNFADGSSSAYILANQQLSSDGFRSGQLETFTIGMNRDCGELVSVEVIPDDISKKSDVYDKLNIQSIQVVKEGTGSLVPTWTISNAGWVGIDYIEDGEEDSAEANKAKGRSNAELAKEFKVTSSTYSVNLTFAISTGSYEGQSQFVGSVQGELVYTNGSGEKIPVTFDVVQAMYSYIGKKAQYSSDKRVISDSKYMFRENTTDRFKLALSDVKSIDQLTLTVKGLSGTTWNIKSVGVTMVTEGGSLVLNENDEYVYTGTSSKLTMQSSKSEPVAYAIPVLANGTAKQTIDFEENTIEENGSYESTSAVITRTPESKKDQLNIFVYPKDTSGMGNYTVSASYRYTNTYGKYYQNGDQDLKVGPDCYYTLGVGADDMSILRSLKLTATGKIESATSLMGSKAVVQRVREGVILETYEISLENIDLVNSWQGMGLQITQKQSTESQTVYAYFTSGTERKYLDDSNDVAISVGFRSTNTFDTNVYHTPYVFLTDEGYKQIYDGMMAELHFNIPFMGEITEIRVAKSGDVKAMLDSAVVATYVNDESASLTLADDASDADKEAYKAAKEEAIKNRTCRSWNSIDVRSELQSESIAYSVTTNDINSADAIVPAYIELKNGGDNSDTENDLNINVRYRTRFSEYSFINISNVKDKMTPESSFDTGGTVKVPMMLTNVESIDRLALTTIEGGKDYTISAASVVINMFGKEQKQTIGSETTVTQQGTEIYFISATMDISATSYAANGSVLANYTKANPIALAVDKDGRIVVTVDYRSNSDSDGYSFELYKIEKSDTSGDTKPLARVANESTVVSRNGDQITIMAEGLDVGSYQLKLTGSESKISTTLEFTVSEPKG